MPSEVGGGVPGMMSNVKYSKYKGTVGFFRFRWVFFFPAKYVNKLLPYPTDLSLSEIFCLTELEFSVAFKFYVDLILELGDESCVFFLFFEGK